MGQRIIRQVVGNSRDCPWAERLAALQPDHLELDTWSAQRSRFVAQSERGERVAIALERDIKLRDGDILHFDAERGEALVVRLKPSCVLVIELTELEQMPPEEQRRTLFELGHAIGNQHWPAVMQQGRICLPQVIDQQVMRSVLQSHRFEKLSFHFEQGCEVIPHLSPHEIRRLFGARTEAHNDHSHAEP